LGDGQQAKGKSDAGYPCGRLSPVVILGGSQHFDNTQNAIIYTLKQDQVQSMNYGLTIQN